MNSRDNIKQILARSGQYTPEQVDGLYDLLDRLSDMVIDTVLRDCKDRHVECMANPSEEAAETPPSMSRGYTDQPPRPVPKKRRGERVIISTEQS